MLAVLNVHQCSATQKSSTENKSASAKFPTKTCLPIWQTPTWKDIIQSSCRGSAGACRDAPWSNFPEGPLASEISNQVRTRLAFYPEPKRQNAQVRLKERNPTMRHLSRCQTENKLPIDMMTWRSVGNNFKQTRLLQTILLQIGRAQDINIEIILLNVNRQQERL